MLVLVLVISNLKSSADSTTVSTSVSGLKTELNTIKGKNGGGGNIQS